MQCVPKCLEPRGINTQQNQALKEEIERLRKFHLEEVRGSAAAANNETIHADINIKTTDLPSSSVVQMLHQRFQTNARELERLEKIIHVCETKVFEIHRQEKCQQKENEEATRKVHELTHSLSLANKRIAEMETAHSASLAVWQSSCWTPAGQWQR